MERLIKLLSLSRGIKDHKMISGIVDRTVKSVSIPETTTTIAANAFNGCRELVSIELHDGLEKVMDYAFFNCVKMELDTIPQIVSSIGAYAFGNCTAITSITFKGTPATIVETAFYGDTNISVINVPWAEGAVAGAPWGATNATINYNVTT